jgi:formiminotetrahydrofolate cyclodeaminase
MNADRTLSGYLEAVSQPTPAPGAGSVAGITGSLGCALGEMVCGITLGNVATDPDERLRSPCEEIASYRAELFELADQDEQAYGRYREAQAMPRATEVEKQARAARMAQTLELATEAPLRIAETSASALNELTIIAELGSRHALADVSTAAYTLEASTRGALENVWVNLRIMKDREPLEQLRARADEALLRCSLALHAVTVAVSERSSGRAQAERSDPTH